MPSMLPTLTFTWRATQTPVSSTDLDNVVTAIVDMIDSMAWIVNDLDRAGALKATLEARRSP